MVSASTIPVAAFPSELPPLSQHEADLLASLVELRFDLPAVARRHDLPAIELIHWATSPATRAHIRALREVTDECTRIRQSQARRTAVDTLEAIATDAEDPIERRRAASSLLRSDHPRRPHRAAELRGADWREMRLGPSIQPGHSPEGLEDAAISPPKTPRVSRDRSCQPSSDCTPSPSLSPEELVYRRFEGFIADDDALQSVANFFPFLTPGAIVCGIPTPLDLQRFLSEQSDGPLIRVADSAPLFHTQETARTESAATITVTLFTGSNAALPPGFRIILGRSSGGPHPGCWLITRIDIDHIRRPACPESKDARPP